MVRHVTNLVRPLGSARAPLKEVQVGSVGELRQALAGLPDDMPVFDLFEAPLLLSFYLDRDTGEKIIEVA